jgi:universal stress protein F
MFKKILLPIDLAEPKMTASAISRAGTLAKCFESELRLVSVQSLVPIAFLDYVSGDFDGEIRRGLEKEIADIAAKIDCPRERVSTIVLFGPIYHKVLDEAKDWGADVIILCSHRPEMARFLIGSNASAIVRHANCSVVVIRG